MSSVWPAISSGFLYWSRTSVEATYTVPSTTNNSFLGSCRRFLSSHLIRYPTVIGFTEDDVCEVALDNGMVAGRVIRCRERLLKSISSPPVNSTVSLRSDWALWSVAADGAEVAIEAFKGGALEPASTAVVAMVRRFAGIFDGSGGSCGKYSNCLRVRVTSCIKMSRASTVGKMKSLPQAG
jgi:hypothetical protein